MKRKGFTVIVLLILSILIGTIGCGPKELSEGDEVVRKAVPEDVLARLVRQASATDSATADAQTTERIVRDIFGRDIPVRIDRIDSCQTIYEEYARHNAQIIEQKELSMIERESLLIRPVYDGNMSGRCFSYIVRYRLPLSPPIEADGLRHEHIDLRLAFLHSMTEAALLVD